MRADRLVSLVLLLQARGQMSAHALAAELEVSVRTVYRDLAALSAAGVPVVAESGPNGGCRLLEGYRFPLRGLSSDEVEALLVLGVPAALAELGLADALSAAHRKISVSAGLRAAGGVAGGAGGGVVGGAARGAAGGVIGGAAGGVGRGVAGPALVHLDMPRWFHGKEDVPHLRTLAEALRQCRRVRLGYQRGGVETTRVVDPFGLVNKAGVWYLVASTARRGGVAGGGSVSGAAASGAAASGAAASGAAASGAAAFRVGRITEARVLAEPCHRPPDFDLAGFWDDWSASFVTNRARVEVLVRASPAALALFGEVFGDAARAAVDAAGPPDERGHREVTLSFEHEAAAAHRLAGFGAQLEVLSPGAVRARLVETARQILERYPSDEAETWRLGRWRRGCRGRRDGRRGGECAGQAERGQSAVVDEPVDGGDAAAV